MGEKRRHLYFLDNQGKVYRVTKKPIRKRDAILTAMEDLYERRSGYKSYYQRSWTDDDGQYWIDYGSHTDFYIWNSKEESEEE